MREVLGKWKSSFATCCSDSEKKSSKCRENKLVKNIKNVTFIVVDKTNLIEAMKKLYKLRSSITFDVLLHMH